MPDEFDKYWTNSFPNCPPISYLFKWRMADRWLRLHSLPNSKRYPDTDEERNEVLRRQNILLDDVIGNNDDCFFVGAAFGDHPTVIYREAVPQLGKVLTSASKPIPQFEVENDDEEPRGTWYVEVGRGTPDIDRLKAILLTIAADELSNFFLVRPKLNRIFAPYDGGVDLILEDVEHREVFEKIYSEWLSLRTDGL